MTTGTLTAGLAVFTTTLLAVYGPLLGLSPWIPVLAVLAGLGALSLDAARFGGRGGHLLAEALPGGEHRLRRIAVHEAGHLLVAAAEAVPVRRVLVGSLACLRAGLPSGGGTEFALPPTAGLAEEELRRWSRVLLAGAAAERILYGDCLGGADDHALLGRLWGGAGHDRQTALREQRRAAREAEALLRRRRDTLMAEAERLLGRAPRLGRAAAAE